ncbi:MAG: LysM peptidoglycan-binding domain-containing protein [Paracoccaceae bacterium]|nr:LysM peptidoglycan-binding domain-containing protein [Paracoccaceae bacterium]MDE2675880.1 LysM peptidoglycan-binding domain-containing protein [Paracoccaceae bacterium]MYG11085.1 LysM peptidoglycan-binding domain-containing protein [Paracoccaceae bacterium]
MLRNEYPKPIDLRENNGKMYLVRNLIVGSCLILLANCAPDIRQDVTKTPDPKVPFDELQKWPKADSDGIFQFDNRRYVEVRRFETLYDVARRINEDPLVIAELNKIRPDQSLQPGKVLLLPYGTQANETGNEAGEQITSEQEIDITGRTENYYRHRVQKGETAYSIANLYDISVRTLADWNELDADFSVMEGEILIIPAPKQINEENVVEDDNTETSENNAPETVVEEESETAEEVSGNTSGESTPPSINEGESTSEQEVVEEETSQTEVEAVEAVQSDGIDCDNFSPAQFGFISPLRGELIEDYSTQSGGNKGLNISAPDGSPVFAVGEGKVALISDLAEGTKVLLVLHDCNIFSIYQNLQDITLARGDVVAQGQRIGTLDEALGYLHFEIRIGPDSADPKEYIPPSSFSN